MATLRELDRQVSRLESRRLRRQSGRLRNVWEPQVGTTLAADAAAAATSITVDDASVFDESGGSLYIGSQAVGYSGYDDETGVVALSAALTEAASTDDPVVRWSTLYNDVETVQLAEVAVEGDRDQADTLVVEVADSLDLRNEDRGLDGENCTIERDGDVWRLISAHGRPSKLRNTKFEANDSYTVTTQDVTAGTVTVPLSHQPITGSLKLWWLTTFQPPTEYTISESAQTVTMTLGSFVREGDVIYVHYAYRKGLAAASGSQVLFTTVGSSLGSGSRTSIAFPAGTLAGDLFIYAAITRSYATNTCADSRAYLWQDVPIGVDTIKIWRGTVSSPGTALTVNAVDFGGIEQATCGLFVIRPERTTDWAVSKVADSGVQGSGPIPGLTDVSGAVGLGFSIAGIGGTSVHTWGSPWSTKAEDGTYARLSFVTQVATTIAAKSAITGGTWRGFALGVGLA